LSSVQIVEKIICLDLFVWPVNKKEIRFYTSIALNVEPHCLQNSIVRLNISLFIWFLKMVLCVMSVVIVQVKNKDAIKIKSVNSIFVRVVIRKEIAYKKIIFDIYKKTSKV